MKKCDIMKGEFSMDILNHLMTEKRVHSNLIGAVCRMKNTTNPMLMGKLRIVSLQKVWGKDKDGKTRYIDGARVVSEYISRNSKIGTQPVALNELTFEV